MLLGRSEGTARLERPRRGSRRSKSGFIEQKEQHVATSDAGREPGLLALVLSAVAVAWACVPRGGLTLDPDSGASGTQATAAVSGFPAGEAVELRWDSPSGPALGSGTGPSFSTTITIPAADPGTYIVIAAVTDEHADHSSAPAAFTIPGSEPAPPESEPGEPFTPGIPPSPFAPVSPTPGGKTITGTSGNDTLVGTPYRDVIKCGTGNDIVNGGGGNDVIYCGAGNDRISGGRGNDRIFGGRGNDRISGGPGNDRLSGGIGRDMLKGGSGNDTLRGNAGEDRLFGGPGRDVLFRPVGDVLSGGAGRDRVIG